METARGGSARWMADLERELDEVFGVVIDEPWGRRRNTVEWLPAVDVYESEDAYTVTADLPGVSAQDVECQVRPWEIEIRGVRAFPGADSAATRVLSERSGGRFCRRLRLEHPVDQQTAESRCADGVYQIMVRKIA